MLGAFSLSEPICTDQNGVSALSSQPSWDSYKQANVTRREKPSIHFPLDLAVKFENKAICYSGAWFASLCHLVVSIDSNWFWHFGKMDQTTWLSLNAKDLVVLWWCTKYVTQTVLSMDVRYEEVVKHTTCQTLSYNSIYTLVENSTSVCY